MFSSFPRSHNGFSLLELLVVLVILGFIVVLIPPRLSGVMTSVKAKTAAREMVSALRQTRSTAIGSQKEQVFKLDLENKSYVIDRKKTKKLPDKLQISLYTARSEKFSEHVGAIRFFPDGSSTGGRIKLSMGKQQLFININWLTGKVALLENIDPDQWKSGNDGFAATN